MKLEAEQFGRALDLLDPKIISAILSNENINSIKTLAEEYGLNEEQAVNLVNTTHYVMIGALNPKSFVPEISKETGLTPDKAREVGQRINEKIFRPVRDLIANLYGGTTVNIPEISKFQEPPNALHSTIDTSRLREARPMPTLPKMKSVDADLLASVGVIKPVPPPPPQESQPFPEPAKKTLGEALEAELGRKGSGVVLGDENKPRGLNTPAPGSFSFSRGFIGHQENESALIREDILKAIENPGGLQNGLTSGIIKPLKPIRTMESDKSEVMEEKGSQTQPSGTTPTQKYTADPYREPLK